MSSRIIWVNEKLDVIGLTLRLLTNQDRDNLIDQTQLALRLTNNIRDPLSKGYLNFGFWNIIQPTYYTIKLY